RDQHTGWSTVVNRGRKGVGSMDAAYSEKLISARQTRRRVLGAAGAFGVGLFAAACGQTAAPSAAPTTAAAPTTGATSQLTGAIKIVSSLPRTGSSKGQTDTIVNAIKMALEEAGGKVGGATVTYEDWDDATAAAGQWDPAQETANANKAAGDKTIMAYIGTFNSGAA